MQDPHRGNKQDKKRIEAAVKRSRNGWFGQIASILRKEKLDEDTWDNLEELLIGGDVGVKTSYQLLENLRIRARNENAKSKADILAILKQDMTKTLDSVNSNKSFIPEGKPTVILMVGVNGAGKTTNIAKMANLYKNAGQRVILGAADTFRAAAIDQLQIWGDKIGIDVIAHQYGADPGAVAYDTIQAAKARQIDVILIDTAGRLHTKFNLMQELEKIKKILDSQNVNSLKVLVTIDATTGQNGLFQAKAFIDSVACDGVLLSKTDSSSKGGIVFSIASELNLPILYMGTGENLDDIVPFDSEGYVQGLFEDLD